MKVVASFVLGLLVACGSSRRDEPPSGSDPVPPSSPHSDPRSGSAARPACKAGAHVCDGDDVMLCEPDGAQRKVSSCRGGCKQGACVETCGANDVELIYVVSSERRLLSFDPRKLPGDPFREIGELTCDVRSSPFSMAVDRTGIAWVLYQTGMLYQVSLIDGHCFSQASRPTNAPHTFGMGFVTDGPKATTEKLYVAADAETRAFATVDTARFPTAWNQIGTIRANQERNPELTGTAEGRLYGYFPRLDGPGFVQELDREGKALGKRWDLPGRGQVGAWAFAFWGDVFYVFATVGGVNQVHAIHRKTGKHELVIDNSAHRIVGAGVSTCAPLLEKPL